MFKIGDRVTIKQGLPPKKEIKMPNGREIFVNEKMAIQGGRVATIKGKQRFQGETVYSLEFDSPIESNKDEMMFFSWSSNMLEIAKEENEL